MSARPPWCMSLLRYTSRCGTDEGGEQVRGDDVDRQEVRAAEDARVVDHRVDRPQPVDLIGHCPGLVEVGEVSDDG